MSTDRLDNDKFDGILQRALKSHSEPVPAYFTDRTVSRIKEAQQRKILARVVLQESLALAGCIILGAAAIISTVLFSDAVITSLRNIPLFLTEQKQALLDTAPEAIGIFRNEWRLYLVFTGVFAFAVYSLLDLSASNGVRKYLHIRNYY